MVRLRDVEAAQVYLRQAFVNGARSVLRRHRTARTYIPPPHRSAELLAMLDLEHQQVIAALETQSRRQR